MKKTTLHKNPLKFENPIRIDEINPDKTLTSLGHGPNKTFVDYGCGTGIISKYAASRPNSKVFALDIDPNMLSHVEDKIKALGLTNITHHLLDLGDGGKDLSYLPTDADTMLLVTVYHEIKDLALFFKHVKHMMKPNGSIGIIEFHKKDSPMGPPANHRLDPKLIINDFNSHQYTLRKEVNLGENLYLLIFN